MYLEIKDLKKSYKSGEESVLILKGLSASVDKGKMCVIEGPSGSGKSTFLNCIGGLDAADSGSITVDGQEVVGLSAAKLSLYRRENLGFIFQFYNLVPNLTVRENIEVCRYLSPNPLDIDEMMESLGILAYKNKFPSQLSGGQQQRCAMDLSMPFAVYLVMYGVIIGLYLVITFFLNRKLDRVSMEQVLKNRE
ncbi:MAG: ATP-binding cassette domain-containing protein [Lachnospiraceae bacterium]|nr:ATP-binding cassette domain-containing protein [Lachnospiraceae bacterium]